MIRRNLLRLVYAVALGTYTFYAYWYVTVYMPQFSSMMPVAMPAGFRSMFMGGLIGGYLIIAAPLAVLTVRPMWAGKLMMLMFLMSAPLAWLEVRILTTSGSPLYDPAFGNLLAGAANFAYILAGLAIIQQIVDPTVWRSTSTWLSKDCPPPWPFGNRQHH